MTVQGWNDGSEDYNKIHRLKEQLALYENFYQYVSEKGTPGLRDVDTVSLACMGLAGETGEMIDLVKKEVFHNIPLDREKFIEEAGDVFHYFIQLITARQVSLKEVIEGNRRKLDKRYPNGWVPGGGIR